MNNDFSRIKEDEYTLSRLGWELFLYAICSINILVLWFLGEEENLETSGGGFLSVLCRSYVYLIYGALIVLCVRTGFRVFEKYNMVLLVSMFAFGLLAYRKNPEGGYFEWMIHMLSYLEIPALFILAPQFRLGDLKSGMLNFFGICWMALFTYRGIISPKHSEYSGALSMGYSNENVAALYIVTVSCYYLMMLKYNGDRPVLKFIYRVALLEMTYLVVKTESRTSTVCVILIWLVLFFGDRYVKPYINTRNLMICMLLPLAFVIVYLMVYDKSWMQNTVIFGKPLASGREYIYEECLEELKGNWLFGNYSFAKFENKHNILLSVAASTGIIGAALFLIYYIYTYRSLMRKILRNHMGTYAFLCMMVLYINGLSEAAMYISGIMFAGLFCSILMFMDMNADTEDEKVEIGNY